jgi:hypothetical protein
MFLESKDLRILFLGIPAYILRCEAVIMNTGSAYKSSKHDALLKNKGTRNRVLDQAYRNKPLTDIPKRINRMNSYVRSIVEYVFSAFELHYGMSKACYLALSGNKARF